MKLNIHPEFQRAMQATRQEEISRAAVRQRAEEDPDRSPLAVRLVRAVTAGVAVGRLVFAEKGAV
jgi:hypothetical protein